MRNEKCTRYRKREREQVDGSCHSGFGRGLKGVCKSKHVRRVAGRHQVVVLWLRLLLSGMVEKRAVEKMGANLK